MELDFFSHPSGRTGRNVIIFGVDMSYLQRLIIGKKISDLLGKVLLRD